MKLPDANERAVILKSVAARAEAKIEAETKAEAEARADAERKKQEFFDKAVIRTTEHVESGVAKALNDGATEFKLKMNDDDNWYEVANAIADKIIEALPKGYTAEKGFISEQHTNYREYGDGEYETLGTYTANHPALIIRWE